MTQHVSHRGSDLRAMVFENLNNAKTNDCDFTGWTPRQIAEDMAECDAQCAEYTVRELIPHVEAWLEEQ
jgi:hypothetical protein